MGRETNRHRRTRLALVPGCGRTEPVGQDSAPVHAPTGELAETCARNADALASIVEHASGLIAAQVGAIENGDLVTAARLAFGQHSALRVVANALGELHTTLDEIAHRESGGAS